MLNVVASSGRYSSASSTDARQDRNASTDIASLLGNLGQLEKERCVLVASESECEASAIGALASMLAPDCIVLPLPLPTAGQVFSVLMSLEHAQMDAELLVLEPGLPANAPLREMLAKSRDTGREGCIAIHGELSTDLPCVVEDQTGISHVAWNRPAAGRRVAGFHWFRRTRQFVEAAEKAILRAPTGTETLGLAAVWNEALLAGARVGTIPVVATAAAPRGSSRPEATHCVRIRDEEPSHFA